MVNKHVSKSSLSVSFDIAHFVVLHFESHRPIIKDSLLLLIQSNLPVLVQKGIVVGHLSEIDGCIVASELMVSSSHSIEL